MKGEKETNFETGKKLLNNYSKYTGIAFQMIAIIGVFAFGGYKLDQWQQTGQPIYTAVLSVTGVCISLYFVVRSATKPDQ